MTAVFLFFLYEQRFVINDVLLVVNGGAGDHTAAVGQDYFMVLCCCVKLHFRPVVLILCGA